MSACTDHRQILAVWDPASDDLPDDTALHLDECDSCRQALDARFAPTPLAVGEPAPDGLAERWIGDWGKAVSTAVVTLLVLTFCEYLPKSWFHARPLARTRRFVDLLRGAELAFRPVSAGVVWLARWLVPGRAQRVSVPVPFVTREDLKVLAREGEKVVALLRGEEATLKTFRPRGHSVRLEPANAALEPIEVPAEDVEIRGVVRGLVRRY